MACDISPEELAAFAAGELAPARAAAIEEHVRSCGDCRRRLESIRAADEALSRLRSAPPPRLVVLEARRAISAQTRARRQEVMTLEEAAQFLRIGPDELEEIAEDLPAFELAGQVRVRRIRLIEWIEKRERRYVTESISSQASRLLAGLEEGIEP